MARLVTCPVRSTSITSCAALAAIALVAGCGGGNNDTTTQAAVTKPEYVQSVKARCGEYQKQRQAAEQPLQELFKSVKDPSQIPSEQLKAASDKVVALDDTTRQVLTDLEALPRPAADKATLDPVFATYADAQAALDEADQAAANGDGAGVSAANNKLDQALSSGSKQVKDEFGFSACG
jgi:DNA topoisomerase IB